MEKITFFAASAIEPVNIIGQPSH
ncbi:hypothetical protein BN873_10134 [Candidatus Competibacter denitrificans Run_A_D11]|uniref:Uncharacterized protein n=1 Tax=Candidatus Competibacter denitrificans Run_A_D11 TaxID=1400863 RepID=W6MAS4_9GAMM|nr:hypothetical protein BN873_10134 [Candidatus Competibacter denitrificans Run_A_D11]